jgi:hypothetical protein
MLAIDDQRKLLIESDPAVAVGTRSSDLFPHGVRGWGPRVSADGRSIEVFIDRPNSQSCIEDLQDNGRVAACFVHVQTLQSLQLKGRCVEISDPAAEDWAWIERHRSAFTEALGSFGIAPEMARNMWSTQVVKLRFVIEEVFDQTPGPHAGREITE